jgi:hypothetical protein
MQTQTTICACGCGAPIPYRDKWGHRHAYAKGHFANTLRVDSLQRFLKYVNKTDACWLWTAGLGRAGYGKFWDGAATVPAHRFSYEIHYGPIPEGLFVCHKCDNPPCVNPDHLFAGSPAANSADRDRKGRGRPPNVFPMSRALGERNSGAKLTAADVVAIRVAYESGGVTQAHLATTYGVTTRTIGRVIRRINWAHVA